jgi:hypothetical protein
LGRIKTSIGAVAESFQPTEEQLPARHRAMRRAAQLRGLANAEIRRRRELQHSANRSRQRSELADGEAAEPNLFTIPEFLRLCTEDTTPGGSTEEPCAPPEEFERSDDWEDWCQGF